MLLPAEWPVLEITGIQENDAALSLFRFYRLAACVFSAFT